MDHFSGSGHRNSSDPIIGNLERAKAIEGFVDIVQHDRFIGVVATSEWAAAQATPPTTGITVSVRRCAPWACDRTVALAGVDLDSLLEIGAFTVMS